MTAFASGASDSYSLLRASNAFIVSIATLPSRPVTLPSASVNWSEGTATSTASASDAMSLYYYVGNKEELLDGMVDLVYGEIELPPADADWKTAMRRVATSAHDAFSRHRWAITLMETRTRPGPANLRHHDSVIRTFREAGSSIKHAIHAFSVLDSYVSGFALQELTLPLESSEELAEVAESILGQFPADEYPHLAETISEHRDTA
ncbi:MAG: TetR/AcrR family transcriptional regulator C-terminal domain-containing protein [Gaiellaceae bacterium]